MLKKDVYALVLRAAFTVSVPRGRKRKRVPPYGYSVGHKNGENKKKKMPNLLSGSQDKKAQALHQAFYEKT